MKLLRDSFEWHALRQRLFASRPAARRPYVVTVPAPLAAGSSVPSSPPSASDGLAATPVSSAPQAIGP